MIRKWLDERQVREAKRRSALQSFQDSQMAQVIEVADAMRRPAGHSNVPSGGGKTASGRRRGA